MRVSLDTIVGLVPGIADAATLVPAGYIIAHGVQLGARNRTVKRMALNDGINAVIGGVPIMGDVFDFVFKRNLRIIALFRHNLAQQSVGGAVRA